MPHTTTQPDPRRPAAASTVPVEGLAAEIGKSTPFDVREEEVFLSLVRTTAWLGEGVAAMLREAGLSTPLYNILRIVSGHAGLAEEQGRPFAGLAVSRIGEHMLTREPDMTRLIDRLEKLGMVVRNRCPEDRRRVLNRTRICPTTERKGTHRNGAPHRTGPAAQHAHRHRQDPRGDGNLLRRQRRDAGK